MKVVVEEIAICHESDPSVGFIGSTVVEENSFVMTVWVPFICWTDSMAHYTWCNNGNYVL